MKKLFSILALSMVIGLFSSCVIVTHEETTPTYTFYFFNNSDYDIRDWYLLDKSGDPYYKHNDGYAEPVNEREISSIKDLKPGLYKVYYEYKNGSSHTTSYCDFTSDVTYKVYEDDFYKGKPRSAASTEN